MTCAELRAYLPHDRFAATTRGERDAVARHLLSCLACALAILSAGPIAPEDAADGLRLYEEDMRDPEFLPELKRPARHSEATS